MTRARQTRQPAINWFAVIFLASWGGIVGMLAAVLLMVYSGTESVTLLIGCGVVGVFLGGLGGEALSRWLK